MGNDITCCQIPTTQNILQQPNLSSSLSQIKIFLKRNPHIQQVLSQKNLISSSNRKIDKNSQYYQKFITLLENHQPLNQIEGVYIGQLILKSSIKQDFIKQGKGVMLYKDGEFYYGDWKSNMRSNQGILIYNDGDYYQGNWRNDQPNGKGNFIGKSPQRKYQGIWKDGKQQGEGTQYYNDGTFYAGSFRQGLKSGKGKIVYKDGTFYQGDFKRNVIQGFGISSGKKHKYQGQFFDGRMHGTGKSEWFNDKGQVIATYIGQYQNGVKHGFGQYRWNAGKTYKGKWQNGEIKNAGVLFQIDSPNKLSMISH